MPKIPSPNKKESETKKEYKKQTHRQVLILACLDLYTQGIYAYLNRFINLRHLCLLE